MNPHVARKIADLMAGKTIVSKESGNSMLPLIRSKQPVRIRPVLTYEEARVVGCLEYVLPEEIRQDDIVLAKVGGSVYTHLVSGIRNVHGELEWQISNRRGHVNGWTRTVYGKIIEVL